MEFFVFNFFRKFGRYFFGTKIKYHGFLVFYNKFSVDSLFRFFNFSIFQAILSDFSFYAMCSVFESIQNS